MKVFFNETMPAPKRHSLFFETTQGWEIVDNSEEADAIAIIDDESWGTEQALKKHYKPHHILLILQLFHMAEYMNFQFYVTSKNKFKHITDKVIIIHNNRALKDHNNIAYFDILFNIEKMYCTEYNSGIDLNQRVWTDVCNEEVYRLHPIEKNPIKKFLAPMRIYHSGSIENPENPRMTRRKQIRALLESMDSVYLSDPPNGITFLPNGYTSDMDSWVNSPYGGVWYPISHTHYNSSIVSIYGESLVHHEHEAMIVTEKTFDPLIRGNFILPFGMPGLIKCITDYGFVLPDWIDYSYDSITNDGERFIAYMMSILKLNSYTLEELTDLCNKDKHILEHNRNVFFTTPYDDLYSNVVNCIKVNKDANWHLNK
jgi:hypothetical protein